MKIIKDKITLRFTAGAVIADKQAVYLSGVNEVSPVSSTVGTFKGIGVANGSAAVGEELDVVVYGQKTVVADGVITAGDRVIPAATAGRVVAGTTAGQIIGKAIGSATAAGDSLEILISLA